MAYRDFKLEDLRAKFGIQIEQKTLFDSIQNQQPSELLLQILAHNRSNSVLRSEKVFSEAIIFPILMEIQAHNNSKTTFFSGEKINANKEQKLNGQIDFLFCKNTMIYEVAAPIILSIHQAQTKGAIEKSFNQTIAQMIGTQAFNLKKDISIPVFGIVTNGVEWRILHLYKTTLIIDSKSYDSFSLNQLLGVLQTIIDSY